MHSSDLPGAFWRAKPFVRSARHVTPGESLKKVEVDGFVYTDDNDQVAGLLAGLVTCGRSGVQLALWCFCLMGFDV